MPDGPGAASNTPLPAFWAIGRLDLPEALFGEVLIPQEVANEFLAAEALARKRTLEAAPWGCSCWPRRRES
jgi:predicted nucleic acid-binding protein